jgi:hypothetical protein
MTPLTDYTLEELRAAIAAKEAAAVDPLLIEAREIAALNTTFPPNGRDYRDGKMDRSPMVATALAALRRGMELATREAVGMSEAEIEAWIERIAQFLHDEGGFSDSYTCRTWPEHPNDTGQRDGGFVKIVPSYVQAHFRDVARRLATLAHRGGVVWPGEDELREMAESVHSWWVHEVDDDSTAVALEMARRLREHMNGGAAKLLSGDPS